MYVKLCASLVALLSYAYTYYTAKDAYWLYSGSAQGHSCLVKGRVINNKTILTVATKPVD